jgi:hypothetical protein
MSRLTWATSRLARLRPWSKIGCRSCAVPVKANVPLLNRPSSSLLALPKLAVSEIRGKKAALAAPMLALAASSCCSAARRSGRRTRRSDGSPAGRSPGICCASSGSGAGRSAGGSGCRAGAAGRLVERALAQGLRERDAGAFEQRLGLAEVELRRAPASKRSFDQAQRFLARRQRLPGDAEQLLVGQHGEVDVWQRRDEADVHRAAGSRPWPGTGQRRLAQARTRPKKVELVACSRQADGIGVGRPAGGRLPCRRGADAERGPLVGAAHLVERARLLDVERGDAQVAVVVEGDADQSRFSGADR